MLNWIRGPRSFGWIEWQPWSSAITTAELRRRWRDKAAPMCIYDDGDLTLESMTSRDALPHPWQLSLRRLGKAAGLGVKSIGPAVVMGLQLTILFLRKTTDRDSLLGSCVSVKASWRREDDDDSSAAVQHSSPHRMFRKRSRRRQAYHHYRITTINRWWVKAAVLSLAYDARNIFAGCCRVFVLTRSWYCFTRMTEGVQT